MAIPTATNAVEVDTLPGEEIAFSIGNAAWVMKQLSKLYSNDVLATIREYSTNAWDAHVEAGVTKPIHVTLPTVYDPFFRVQDFGVGMSPETLKEVYTKFGDSTKRNSNDFNGMLGFGSKAALAYTDSFTVESVKDGVKTSALIARKPDWSITMRIVSVAKTTEANGTKVVIPSHSHPAFAQIARDFYRFWAPGTVRVDGAEPEQAVGDKLDDNLYFSKTSGTSYVVQGNVAYRIVNAEALFRNRGMASISFVAYVPNGSVEFTPSREDLEYTDETKKALHGIIEDFEKKMLANAKADIATATTFAEAYTKYTHWTNRVGKGPFGDLTFKGEKFVDAIDIKCFRYRPSEYRYNMYAQNGWNITVMHETLIVTGVKGTPNSTHKARSKQYAAKEGLRANYILFTEDTEVKSVWIDSRRVVDWDTVKTATKPPRQHNAVQGPKRIKGTFDYITKSGWSYEKPLPDTKNLYYISVADSKSMSVASVLQLLDDAGTVVVLAINRIEKFKRDNPHVKSFVEVFRKKVNLDGDSLIDSSTREALALGDITKNWLSVLNVDSIKDPEFKRLKNLLSADRNKGLAEYQKHHALAKSLRMGYDFKVHRIMANNNNLVNIKYPLLAQVPVWRVDAITSRELTIYINAKFNG